MHQTYAIPPHSRFTIWVDEAAPELAATDVSAEFESNRDIVVERAMYFDSGGIAFRAGHAAAAVPAPALDWYFAEGATGPFFDTYVLIANPSDTPALVQTDYLLPDGMAVPREFTMAPHSRHTVRMDEVHPWLSDTAASVHVPSRNGVPIVVERSMWWPDGQSIEAHVSSGAVSGGTRWLLADGEVGGPRQAATYTLIANISEWPATVRVSLLFEGGGEVQRDVTVPALSRSTFDASAIPEANNRRFATLVESVGTRPAELVVEQSMYDGAGWEGGLPHSARTCRPRCGRCRISSSFAAPVSRPWTSTGHAPAARSRR